MTAKMCCKRAQHIFEFKFKCNSMPTEPVKILIYGSDIRKVVLCIAGSLTAGEKN